MPTTTKVKTLKINRLTEAQYDAAVQAGQIGENEISILTDVDAGQVIQVDTLPTAAVEELDKIYQFIGTTDANYTNGYFYKCVSDGAVTPTYSWTRVDVQPQGDSLPSQSGNAGKFLTTDGTDASWTNEISNTNPLYFTGHNRTGCGLYIGDTSGTYGNKFIKLFSQEGSSLMIENAAFNGTLRFEFGNAVYLCALNATSGTNLGSNTYKWTRLYTTKINNGTDIDVPTVGGKLALQTDTMPTASSTNEGVIYQFTGTTDSTYTNGHFYKCVSDGATPTPAYSWEEVQLGGSSLPSQTGNAGKFLTTDGTDASWSDKPLVNEATGNNNALAIKGTASGTNSISIGRNSSTAASDFAVAIGSNSHVNNYGGVAIGSGTYADGARSTAIGLGSTVKKSFGVAIGLEAYVDAPNAIQISAHTYNGGISVTNSDANTFKVANENGNYEIMSADGTIPTDRFTTTPSVAGTYSATLTVDAQGNVTRSWAAPVDPLPSQTGNAGKVLMTNGTTASWVDIGSTPQTMPTLVAANWSSNTQTVSVTGVTATNVVMVSPAPVNATEYAQCGILCTAQANGTLTFTCTSVPSNDITVNVVCF